MPVFAHKTAQFPRMARRGLCSGPADVIMEGRDENRISRDSPRVPRDRQIGWAGRIGNGVRFSDRTAAVRRSTGHGHWGDPRRRPAPGSRVRRPACENGVSAFLKKVRNFDLTGVTDYEITDRRGHITKNGLRFSYQINDHGNINTELKVYTNCGDYDYLANFALMSAGKYQSK